MAKVLLIGDVHAVVEELQDCQNLINYICKIAVENKASVCFMGDQYNTMSVVRVEVLNFWTKAYRTMTELGLKVFALVGNHDYAGAGLYVHSMVAHASTITVVDEASVVAKGVIAVPHFDKGTELIESLKNDKNKTVLCHQTFVGAKYDNGFYAPDGVDPDLLPQENIISGHIHTPMSFGKVTYIGAPRWRTLSDANVERNIWLYDFDDVGNVISKTPFSTGGVCRQIRYLRDLPSEPITETLSADVDWRIDIKGPADWIEKRKSELSGPGVKIRTFKTTGAKLAVKESDGISLAFSKYLNRFTPKYGTEKSMLSDLAKERLGV